MVFRTASSSATISNSQEIVVNDETKKIDIIRFSTGSNTREISRSNEYEFNSCLTIVFQNMMHNNVCQFVSLLKSIRQTDLTCYASGKAILEEERKKYELD